MQEYGIPGEVLSDNGKQFTGRFGKPRPAEVLFERICRENGITQRLTKPRSPTTTGKIERLHQTLQQELLNVHSPFASIEDAQAAVDTWRKQYNTDRPHQSLAMAFPAARFTRAAPAFWACVYPPSSRGQPELRSPSALKRLPGRHGPCRCQVSVSQLTGRRWSWTGCTCC
jgi:transposase InsO family protein